MQPNYQDADRKVLHLNQHRKGGRVVQDTPPRREMDPRNGHEAILRTMIKKKATAILVLTDGTTIAGRVSQFDHFTITIYPEDNAGRPETFFKHGIRSFTSEAVPDAGE